MTAAIIIIGILGLGWLGVGRISRNSRNMDEWAVGGRDFPRWTSWFLQAGESLTTFSFLGLAGLAFTTGASATYAVGYLTASAICLYFIAPRMRALGAQRGYLTMADFFQDRYGSRLVSVIVGLVGAIFLIPYLVLQITGLGLIVSLATDGSASARKASMVIASIVVVVFVASAGIRGIARVAVLKDFAMLIALLVVFVAVLKATGGFPGVFDKLDAFTAHTATGQAYPADVLFSTSHPGWQWFFSSVLITTLGAGFNTFPHIWPAILSSESGATLRSNYKWVAIYQLLLFMPIIVGMAAVLKINATTVGNQVLLTIGGQSMPSWLMALVGVAGASAAMVPAAAIAMGISSSISQNVLYRLPAERRFRVNQAFIVVAVAVALYFALAGADIGNMLLLTYGGLAQMVPATAAALPNRVRLHWMSVFCGIVVGVVSVAYITWGDVDTNGWDSGFISLGVNLVVLAIVELIVRATSRNRLAEELVDVGVTS